MIDLEPGVVPFQMHRIRNPRVLWAARQDERARSRAATEPIESFAYGITDSACFSHVDFDAGAVLTATAERYGGFGTGVHGGGARVANVGAYQLKGIGRNPLAGPADGTLNGGFHGFGGMPLVDAVCEVVNSLVFGSLLPIGVVQCHGLILSGENTAFYPQRVDAERSAGAILVRERCLRPAHFLRTRNYTTPPEILLTSGSDVSRVRRICQEAKSLLGGDRGFAGFVGSFLRNCANQFAFARLWRINHGSVSPSNIAVDGRWLDVMGASFLDPGMNYTPSANVAPFTREAASVRSIVAEWVDTYSKYCATDLAIEPLMAFYDRQLSAFGAYHLSSFFGLPTGSAPAFHSSPHAMTLKTAVMSALDHGLKLTDELPHGRPDAADPAVTLVEGLSSPRVEGIAGVPPEIRLAYRELTETTVRRLAAERGTPLAIRSLMMIRSLKRLCFAPVFSRGRLIGEASSVVLSGDRDAIDGMITAWAARANWIFDQSFTSQSLVEHDGLTITYSVDGVLSLSDRGSVERFVGPAGLRRLLSVVAALPKERLRTQAYFAFPPVSAWDFRPGLNRILGAMIASHEHQEMD